MQYSGTTLSMEIPTPPPFEPDFEVESPHWFFTPEPPGFRSGQIFIRLIDATDEMVKSSPDAINWLFESF